MTESGSRRGGIEPIRSWRPELRTVTLIVSAYAVIRLVTLVVWWLASTTYIDGEPQPLWAWDGFWFLRLADEGYPDHLSLITPRDESTAGLAFLPLYPMAMRALGWVGVPGPAAGLTITVLAGVAAAVGIYAVGRELLPRGAAFVAVVLWAAMPMSVVLTMVYSEALFTALAAWAVWAAMRHRWLLAGVLGLLAGLTRPSGLGVGVAVAAAAALWWWHRRTTTEPRDPLWRPVLGAVLASAGVPLWWLYVAVVSGRIDGWFAAQDFFWGSRFDFGVKVATTGWRMLTFDGFFQPLDRVVYTGTILALLLAVVLCLELIRRAVRERRWLPVAAYAVTLVVLTVGSAGFIHSKMRFLVPIFPLVFVVAGPLSRAAAPVRWAAMGLVVLGGAWWSTMMLTVWPYAI